MNEYKPKINVRKTVIVMVLAVIAMAVAGWLLSRENFYEMLAAVKSADPLLIASAIAIYFIGVAVWSARWQTALKFIGCRMGIGIRYLICTATIFLNNITPMARAGGDPFGRAYMMRKFGNINYSSGLGSIIGERALFPLVIVSFLMAGLIFRFGPGSIQLTLILAVVWAVAGVGAVFGPRFIFKRRIAIKGVSGITNRVLGWFGRRRNIRELVTGIEAFYASTYATMDKWQQVLAMATWTLVIGALDVFRVYVIFLALGYQPTLPMLLVSSSFSVIVGMIPFLPGGLVLVEGSFVSVFALFGVPLNIGMAATLIERGITFVLSTIVGAVVFSGLGIKMAAKPGIQG